MSSSIDDIPGLIRIENTPQEQAIGLAASYTPGPSPFVTVEEYIDAPPQAVHAYLSDIRNLDEFTYSTRAFQPVEGKPGLYEGRDPLAHPDTKIFMRIEADPAALTVDMHCAWDQGEELWMVYLHRIVDAQTVLGRPGSVVLWTNSRHPYYDKNPFPELAPTPERPWVGDFWDIFAAAHALELQNLKKILEHRHGNGGAA
ncbi:MULTISPECIES: SRPBCC family protein [Streptomyces]|uniref:SRPBCC family protein n=1 Tax=Streptomyces TaxID=1883 RepID=UPI0019082D78|nr:MULTISPECIES: SRPBCC family protein [unclassified Streptomyces]MCU4745687.1 SRPBCC family protein [Streptomyces sp. G-5]QQN79338.1 SRPBCC family protein [Streptomyces sp. XC 2026]